MISVLQARPGVRMRRLGNGHHEVSRLIPASNERQVVDEIRREGGTPLEIKKHRKTFLGTEIVLRTYKQRFLQALAFNVEAGLSAGKALEMVIQSESKVALQLELSAASAILAKGGSFSEAIDSVSFFDRATISIMVAGEKTGSLRQALSSAVEHYESRNHTSKAIFGMLSFVSIDLATVVVSAFGVQTKFIPMMEEQGANSTDPAVIAAFQEKIQLGYLLNGSLLWIAAIVALIAFLFSYFILSPKPSPMKTKAESLIRRIPVLSSFFTNSALAESFGVAASMLAGGVRLNETIDVASQATTYPVVLRYWDAVRRRMMLGDATARALFQPPLTQQEFLIISAHRSAEQLTKVIRDIAKERAVQARHGAGTLNRILLLGSIAYASASVFIYLWLLFVQNEQIMSILK